MQEDVAGRRSWDGGMAGRRGREEGGGGQDEIIDAGRKKGGDYGEREGACLQGGG